MAPLGCNVLFPEEDTIGTQLEVFAQAADNCLSMQQSPDRVAPLRKGGMLSQQKRALKRGLYPSVSRQQLGMCVLLTNPSLIYHIFKFYLLTYLTSSAVFSLLYTFLSCLKRSLFLYPCIFLYYSSLFPTCLCRFCYKILLFLAFFIPLQSLSPPLIPLAPPILDYGPILNTAFLSI